jgi:uncharacterized protein YndB with AHSA1/START domain
MPTISHDFQTQADPAQVFRAVSTEEGYKAWWCRNCTADMRPGGEAHFRFRDGEFTVVCRVDRLEPERSVRMKCIRAQGAEPWVGTTLEFDLEPIPGGGSDVRFRHAGWAEVTESDYLAHCTNVWAHFMKSLQEHVEKGAGTPE